MDIEGHHTYPPEYKPAPGVKYMDIDEFVSEGYLQEVNRQFLHPLGLALETYKDDLGNTYLSGIWDYRDDPDGMRYDASMDLVPKYENIKVLLHEKRQSRRAILGYVVQSAYGDTDKRAWRFDPKDSSVNTRSEVAIRQSEGVYQLWVVKSMKWCDIAPGDYVIAEPDGEGYYPCVKAIFEAGHTSMDAL